MNNLQKLRKSTGLTQAEAGSLIHLKPESWGQAEIGKFKIDPAKLELFRLKTAELVAARKALGF